MARKSNLARNVGIVSVVIVGIVAIMLFPNTSNFTLLEDNVLGEVNVSIPTQNSLISQGFIPISQPIGADIAEASGIDCKIKQTTIVYGVNNRQIKNLDSSGIQGSPFITLAFVEGREIEVVAYNVNPKIFCSESSGLALEVAVRDLQVTTRGSYLNVNNKILDSQGVSGSRLLNFGQGQSEQTLVSLPISVATIENQLPNQDFTIDLVFAITGTVNVNYRDFPSLTYQIPIFRADMETFDTIDIRKAPSQPEAPLDSDGDGYPDSTDQCDNEPENFNGFQDEDGCADVKPSNEPEPEPNPREECTNISLSECSIECTDAGHVFVFERDSRNVITDGYCDMSGISEEDPEPDPEACPVGFSFNTNTQTCEEQETVIDIEEEVLKGSVISVVEVVFTDGSNSKTVAQSGQGSGFPDLQTDIGGLTPAVLIPDTITPSGTGIINKPISLIRVEMFYLVNPSTPENSFGLDSISLRMTPTVDESSVSMASGTFINFRSADIGSPQDVIVDKRLLGTGFSLGNAQVTSSTLLDIAEDANILEGQADTADIILTVEGSVDFASTGQATKFNLEETTVTFKDFFINNSASPVADIVCTPTQVSVKDVNGKVIDCRKANPTDGTCFTSERPNGFTCSQQEAEDNCPNTLLSCTEPDSDGDGVPDFKDKCSTLAEDRVSSGLAVADDGCPAPSTPPPEDECPSNAVCDGERRPEVEPPKLCSEANPEACIVPPEDFPMIIIIGGIIIVVIGVVLAVALRRR